MVGGQMLDLAAEGRFDGTVKKLGAADVKLLQSMKTGALLRFGCLAGAMLGEATATQREALDRYGSVLGEAFQIADDLLDVEGDAATVGKATGKDAAAGKGTFVTVLGLDGAKARLKTLVGEAEQALSIFGRDGDVLKMAARFVAERKA
jgi:farnesyl diphosphate synthase